MIIGEVLFDHFPGGKKVLGGAPFNVAWNLQGFNQRPLFVSAVGRDETGKRVLEQMAAWAMDRTGIQQLPNYPTGKVEVTFDSGQPSYEIVPNQAYDYLEFEPLNSALDAATRDNMSLIYHGSLAWRSPKTRNVIQRLRQQIQAPVFVDLNIRQPWFEPVWLDDILSGVTWVKLNADELAELTGRSISESSTRQHITDAVAKLRQRFPAEIYFVTAGADGADAFPANGPDVFTPTPKMEQIADTVGAGDAFAAIAIHGLLEGWSCPKILDTAAKFAAKVCQLNGATIDEPKFYQIAAKSTEQDSNPKD